jgi:hypothetical protein
MDTADRANSSKLQSIISDVIIIINESDEVQAWVSLYRYTAGKFQIYLHELMHLN